MRRQSQEWAWGDPVEDAPVNLEEEFYSMPETAAVIAYFDSSAAKINKWIRKKLQRTRNPDVIYEELLTYLMGLIVDSANRLGPPFDQLVLTGLAQVHWDTIVTKYMQGYMGPQFFSEEDELSAVDQMLEGMDMPESTDEVVAPSTPKTNPIKNKTTYELAPQYQYSPTRKETSYY
jgi:hypothetical protein